MKYQCIVSDLDHTLLGADGRLAPSTAGILRRLMDAGVLFVPATGRPFSALPEDIRKLPGIRYAITSNGASIYDMRTQQPVYASKLPEDAAVRLFQTFTGKKLAYEAFVDGIAYIGQDYYEDPSVYGVYLSEREIHYIQTTRTPVPDIKAFILEHRHELDSLDLMVGDAVKWDIYGRIERELDNIYVTTSVAHLIEISGKESGKHNSVLRLADMLGLDMSAVVAFGDGDNDSQMLKTAGLGVAMGNGSLLCKQMADIVAESNDRGGVEKVLAEIFSDICRECRDSEQ